MEKRGRERKKEGLVESSYQVLAGILHVRERVGVTTVVAVLKTTQGSQLSAANAVETLVSGKSLSPSPSSSSTLLHLWYVGGGWFGQLELHEPQSMAQRYEPNRSVKCTVPEVSLVLSWLSAACR